MMYYSSESSTPCSCASSKYLHNMKLSNHFSHMNPVSNTIEVISVIEESQFELQVHFITTDHCFNRPVGMSAGRQDNSYAHPHITIHIKVITLQHRIIRLNINSPEVQNKLRGRALVFGTIDFTELPLAPGQPVWQLGMHLNAGKPVRDSWIYDISHHLRPLTSLERSPPSSSFHDTSAIQCPFHTIPGPFNWVSVFVSSWEA